jgi:HlyD family secretion protein
MSLAPTKVEPPEMAPRSNADIPSHAKAPRKVDGGRFRWGRWLLCLSGFVVVGVGIWPGYRTLFFLPTGKAPGQATETRATPQEGGQKLVVCYGYADLEGGIASLHPTQAGRVAEILVHENDTVTAGAPLLRLDDRSARFRVDEAKGILDEANARLAKAEKGPEQHRLKIAEQQANLKATQYRLTAAQRTLASRQERQKVEAIGKGRDDPVMTEEVAATAERIKEFAELVKQEESKLSALELHNPEVEVQRVRAEVATMRARLNEAEQVLAEHTLKAPEAGRVLRIFVTPGELVSLPPKKMALQFCPDKPRIIRAEVDQAYAPKVEIGQPASVEDDNNSGLKWRGRVLRISDWYTQRRQVADEQLQLKDVRTLECLIALDPDQPPLRIGQRVRVTITRTAP